MSPAPMIIAVNVVNQVRTGPHGDTAIDKRPIRGPVRVGELGLAGDRQCDTRHHGGPDKAVYAYASEDAAWWADELGREVPPGTLFGENLTTIGLDITGARIGEQWRIGPADDGVVLEVRMPRTPCENLAHRIGEEGFHKRFLAAGRVGAYLRVVRPGTVSAGDPITVVEHPDHDLTIGGWFTNPTPATMRQVLDSGIILADPVRRRVRRIATRATD